MLLCTLFYAVRIMVRTFGQHLELPDASTIVGTMSSDTVPKELVEIRRIETANSSDVQIYIVCSAWIALFFYVSSRFLWTIYIQTILFVFKVGAKNCLKCLTCRKDTKQFLEKYSTQELARSHPDDALDQE